MGEEVPEDEKERDAWLSELQRVVERVTLEMIDHLIRRRFVAENARDPTDVDLSRSRFDRTRMGSVANLLETTRTAENKAAKQLP